MTAKLRLAKLELFEDGAAHDSIKPRNLGGAIFLVAIDDYCSTDVEVHETARKFLFPPNANWQNHFDWAASLVEGLNPGWLRDALDRSRASWDTRRAERLLRTGRRKLRLESKTYGRKTRVERVQTAVAVGSDRVAV